jgi:hypothetical protein
MSDAPRRLIEIGTYEGGLTHLIVPREALARAEQKLAAERAEAERVRLAALADIARVKNTRRVMTMRRFKRALRLVGMR